MNRNGPIIIVDDDEDDRQILATVLQMLPYDNPVMFFPGAEEALGYLSSKHIRPFLIFSDINMPKLNGIQFREKILNGGSPHIRRVPFLFITTSAAWKTLIDAYAQTIQGFFIKPSNFEAFKKEISIIIEYWRDCTDIYND